MNILEKMKKEDEKIIKKLNDDPELFKKIFCYYTIEDLAEMIEDDNPETRKTVARCGHGYGSEQLANDENKWVRLEVARQGYELEKLINDKERVVRNMALNKLRKLVKKGKIKIIKEK